MSPASALLVCPGRGSYGKEDLGSLQTHPELDLIESVRASSGRPPLRALDGEERFRPGRHLAGQHASLLTFASTLQDARQLDPDKVSVAGVTGNSMGWYTALALAGALPVREAAQLVETMGGYQEEEVIGAQFLYPLSDERWLPDAQAAESIERALQHPEVHLSIRLGGTAVLGCSREAAAAIGELLPAVQRGRRSFPIQLPKHAAFHTPLLEATSRRAQEELRDLSWSSPTSPLISGQGQVYRSWASPRAIRDYTLGAQVVDTYHFTDAVRVALGHLAPDQVICLGPGNSMGAPVAQSMIAMGWRGLRDRQDFKEAQSGARPLLISTRRPEQAALVFG